jgi:hypothetical protein
VVRTEGGNPLTVYEEPEIAARQIAAFAGMEGVGDVICFAAAFGPETLRDATPGAVGEPHVYTFEHQLGTHASLGGDQSYPFIVLPARLPLDPASIVTAGDMHQFLRTIVPHREIATGRDGPLILDKQEKVVGKVGYLGDGGAKR